MNYRFQKGLPFKVTTLRVTQLKLMLLQHKITRMSRLFKPSNGANFTTLMNNSCAIFENHNKNQTHLDNLTHIQKNIEDNLDSCGQAIKQLIKANPNLIHPELQKTTNIIPLDDLLEQLDNTQYWLKPHNVHPALLAQPISKEPTPVERRTPTIRFAQ